MTRFGAHEGGLLVEEYLGDRVGDGTFADDMAVELLAQNGRVWHLATTGKFRHAPPFRSRGCFLPSHVDAATEAELFDAAEAAVRAVGISDGFANVDLKLTPEGPRIVEVNGRLGGNVHVLMELAGGLPILPLVFRLALGQDMAAEPTVARVGGGQLAADRLFRLDPDADVGDPLVQGRGTGRRCRSAPRDERRPETERQGDALDWARRWPLQRVRGVRIRRALPTWLSHEKRSMPPSRSNSTRPLLPATPTEAPLSQRPRVSSLGGGLRSDLERDRVEAVERPHAALGWRAAGQRAERHGALAVGRHVEPRIFRREAGDVEGDPLGEAACANGEPPGVAVRRGMGLEPEVGLAWVVRSRRGGRSPR